MPSLFQFNKKKLKLFSVIIALVVQCYCYPDTDEWLQWHKTNVVRLGYGIFFDRRNRKYRWKIQEIVNVIPVSNRSFSVKMCFLFKTKYVCPYPYPPKVLETMVNPVAMNPSEHKLWVSKCHVPLKETRAESMLGRENVQVWNIWPNQTVRRYQKSHGQVKRTQDSN